MTNEAQQPATHGLSLTVLVCNSEDWSEVYGRMSDFVEEGPKGYAGISFNSFQLNDGDAGDEEELFYDENTLTKVRQALQHFLDDVEIEAAINQMQNDGILFRERAR